MIFELPKIKKLTFGVQNFQDSSFLSKLNLQNLEELVIGETKKRDIDLTPIAAASNLKALTIVGHTTNIKEVKGVENLSTLRLNCISNKRSLGFVSDMKQLRSLRVILGGRQNIDEITHENLEHLELVRVRGFNDLGELSRFPQLQELQIEDQIKLMSISFENPKLKEVKLLNCKNLNELKGLQTLSSIEHLRCSRTSLNYGELSQFNWPQSLKLLALYTGRKKEDIRIRQQLDAAGYEEFS